MPENIFVLGLDELNLETLRRLPVPRTAGFTGYSMSPSSGGTKWISLR